LLQITVTNRAAGAVSFVEYVQEKGGQVEIAQKPESAQGFVPEKNRWMLERSFGWLNFRPPWYPKECNES
jgi:hypothetical protein